MLSFIFETKFYALSMHDSYFETFHKMYSTRHSMLRKFDLFKGSQKKIQNRIKDKCLLLKHRKHEITIHTHLKAMFFQNRTHAR